MRHRVLGALGASGAAHDVLHLGNARSTSSTRWFRRSTSSSDASGGTFVCSRSAPSSSRGMKSRPSEKPSDDRRDRDQPAPRRARAPRAASRRRARAVARVERANQPGRPRACRQPARRRTRPSSRAARAGRGQREQERAASVASTATASGAVHASFDAAHPEQRQEHRDDDERREHDRPADFDRGVTSARRAARAGGGVHARAAGARRSRSR